MSTTGGDGVGGVDGEGGVGGGELHVGSVVAVEQPLSAQHVVRPGHSPLLPAAWQTCVCPPALVLRQRTTRCRMVGVSANALLQRCAGRAEILAAHILLAAAECIDVEAIEAVGVAVE